MSVGQMFGPCSARASAPHSINHLQKISAKVISCLLGLFILTAMSISILALVGCIGLPVSVILTLLSSCLVAALLAGICTGLSLTSSTSKNSLPQAQTFSPRISSDTYTPRITSPFEKLHAYYAPPQFKK